MGWKHIKPERYTSFFIRNKLTDQYSYIELGEEVESDTQIMNEKFTTWKIKQGIFKDTLNYLNSSEEVYIQTRDNEWRIISPTRYTSAHGDICKLSPMRLCIPMPQFDFQINDQMRGV
tara:strand:- start:1305 stop:1658 length:354 start_codon:yes stop_codon:yes gene_type:complete